MRKSHVEEDTPESFQHLAERERCFFKMSWAGFFIGGASLSKLYGALPELGFISYTTPSSFSGAVNINSSDLLLGRPSVFIP